MENTLTKKASVSNLLNKAQKEIREKRLQEKLALQVFNEANDSKILGKGLKSNFPPPD